MTTVREWRNEAWCHGKEARDQRELSFMFRKIMEGADSITNEPTPGCSRDELSRVIRCKSSMIPNTEYIIHVNGFTVEDITELVRT